MEHEFVLNLTLPITAKQAEQLLIGRQRLVFRKIDPHSNEVLETGIGCNVCGKSAGEALTNPVCEGSPLVAEVVESEPEITEETTESVA